MLVTDTYAACKGLFSGIVFKTETEKPGNL